MKFFVPWGCQRLSFLLEKAASREAKMWKVYVPKKPSPQDTDVSPAQRDEAVRWLTELHSRLQLYPETLVLAVSILDRFLAPIKARPKYLRCIAITCFFLAAKTCEEDEHVPSLKEMAAASSCGCSPSEILRMERIILDKLNWDLHTATALDFLHIFHVMLLTCRSGFADSMLGLNRSQHLTLLTRRLYHCLADYTLIQLRGSMLALALITMELEICCPDWLVLTIDLLRKAQIDSSELIRSRELVERSLSTPRASLPPNTVYIYQPLQSQTTLQPLAQDPALPCYQLGIIAFTNESSRDHALVTSPPAQLKTAAGGEDWSKQPWISIVSCSSTTTNNHKNNSSIPVLVPPPKHLRHLKVTLRCKASTKRKVEEMEVDDFYDCIKRLYNEDFTTGIHEGATPSKGAMTTGGGREGVGLGVCSVLLTRQEGSSSPCPPLQPVSAS
ncbi:cyclin-I [Cyclopterus lumpus]|uniref:Cyclin-I n=1 Tax=Cyclopterus lumpus TaxID=8103 RepID=A0A8C3AL54_CYCLU|nr:cyclin-I [Cyclopterus lumpus]XP_034402463.1 cyclin-I [Cyclopterus lumpus]XP_034402464.1 cyclin-I [Cyclopterus lumpus]XP_034402465.1 cyclin-I [Cyclopterus lumpus]